MRISAFGSANHIRNLKPEEIDFERIAGCSCNDPRLTLVQEAI
jgi:hypothetical protein